MVEAALREASYRDLRSTKLSRSIRFADGAVFVRLDAMATVRMSARSGAMDEEARERAVAVIIGTAPRLSARIRM